MKRFVGIASLGLVFALGISVSFAGGVLGANSSSQQVLSSEDDAPEGYSPDIRTQPTVPVIPQRLRTCSLDALAKADDLGDFYATVVDPLSGEQYFGRNDQDLVAPASVMKILTAVSALLVLGPDATFSTVVKASKDSGTVFLVGGGDATLSRLSGDQTSVYSGAPRLHALAEQTIAYLDEGEGVSITEVVVDESLWSVEDARDASWAGDATTRGFISLVTPLQIDGDRANPSAAVSPRGSNPGRRAGEAFVQALREAGNEGRFVKVTTAVSEADAPVIATVSSRPVSELVAYMLKDSDNTLAEMLARHVSLKRGGSGSAASLQDAIVSPLADFGPGSTGIVAQDGSGLSALNQVTPEFVAALLVEVKRSNEGLLAVMEGLPVAGVDGSLKDRFAGEGNNLGGNVYAKTGSISGVRSLAGFVRAADGSELAFAVFATGTVGDNSREALDAVVGGMYSCGANLADF